MANSKKFFETTLTALLFKASKLERSRINDLLVGIGITCFLLIGYFISAKGLNILAIKEILPILVTSYGILLGFTISSYGIFASCNNLEFIETLLQYKDEQNSNLSALEVILIIFVQFFTSLLLAFVFTLLSYIFLSFYNCFPDSIVDLILFNKTVVTIIWFAILGLLIIYPLIQAKALIYNLYALTLTQANLFSIKKQAKNTSPESFVYPIENNLTIRKMIEEKAFFLSKNNPGNTDLDNWLLAKKQVVELLADLQKIN